MATRSEAVRPRALRAGSRIALVAPAGPVTEERVSAAVQRCEALGLEPVVLPGSKERAGFLAGPDEVRLRDLQTALDDPAIDAVWALRGGYGITRILAKLDLRTQLKSPKPYIGFSDNTAMHAAFFGLGVVSFHGPHAGAAFPPETAEAFERVLFSTEPAGRLPLRVGDPQPQTLVPGVAEAPLVGGNVALLAALCGTRQCIRAHGCVLFLEDVGEPAYRLDRMLVQLRDARVLEGVAGLALGRFTEAPAGEDDLVAAVIRDFADSLGVPAVADLPVGHVDHNWTLPVGVRARLDADAGSLELMEAAVKA